MRRWARGEHPAESFPERPALRRPVRVCADVLRPPGTAAPRHHAPGSRVVFVVPAGAAPRPDLPLHALRRRREEGSPVSAVLLHQEDPSAHSPARRRRPAQGGVVWHTQGSGKSLTMVMLAKAIVREDLPDYKVVLVTDRVDLDDQIYKTFRHCDMEPDRARSGRHLAKLLKRAEKPRDHHDHRQVRDRRGQVRPSERERQHLRPGG